MACYHPLKGYQFGWTDNGKPNYKITSFDTILYDENGKEREYQLIPCGKCVGCRLAYSRAWADRCMAEASYHDSSFFVTLTYDNDHIPNAVIKDTGEIMQYGTLVKRDCQLFMKRLRKNYRYDNKIRFFLAGEYGSQTARPHYHVILFGLKLNDLVLYKKDRGYCYWTSKFIEEAWQHKGYCVVAPVTWETCAYTARYIMKKQNGEASKKYDELGIIPEFTLMSRKPGISFECFEDNKESYLKFGEVNISTEDGGRSIKNIKYWNKHLEIEYPDDVKLMKEKCKKKMEVIQKIKESNTDKSYLELLATAESIKTAQARKLIRKEI